MPRFRLRHLVATTMLASLVLSGATSGMLHAQSLTVSPAQTLEGRGLSVIVDQNQFNPIFFDEKNAGIQLILHGERIATDGAVRLNPTPEQWDPVPLFVSRALGTEPNQIVVHSAFKTPALSYQVKVTAEDDGFRIAVDLDAPLPAALAGKAGFNLDFVPPAYFGKTYLLGDHPGLFPRNAGGAMATDGSGDPQPLAAGGNAITLSPEDPLTRVTIRSDNGPLALYDARTRAQNGWFVVRSMIAAGAQKDAVVWHVRPNRIKDWVRPPVVSFNQAGYTPGRDKVAMIEMDPAFVPPAEAELVQLTAEGPRSVLHAPITPRGRWARYAYAAFDFSAVRTPGIYAIRFAGQTTNPFRIAADAYDQIWQPSLDTYLAEQMDHVSVREQYRVWQAPSHLDDARQAPANLTHFDAYRTGPELDSPFKPGEHIPGLAVGGWQDAGDYDIQTPDNSWVVRNLVWTRELFGTDWDQTTVDEAARAVQIRKPDGVEDALQQIRHGTLQLLAQYKVFGHAIDGIVDPTLQQYTHLGDAASQTDGRVYDPALGPNETVGDRSGKPDDRWAFTTDQPATDLDMVSGLAGASRALAASDPAMAKQALDAARAIWANQRNRLHVQKIGRGFGFAPGQVEAADISATAELILATKGDKLYVERMKALMPFIADSFEHTAAPAVRVMPYMDAAYAKAIEALVRAAKAKIDARVGQNPFGVPIAEGSWAGSNEVAAFGATMYVLHQAFPAIVGKDYTLRAIDYLLGRHPANNLSLVSGVGTQSKLMAYGHNRADMTYVAGGLVPGVILIKPDYPEAKADWPFLWFESEYTVSTTSSYILAAKAAIAAAKE